MAEKHPPVLSPVDYDAWNRGYMPPSEHILIDQLAYRGARVIMSMDHGDHGAIFIVTRALKMPREARIKLLSLIGDVLDLQAEPALVPGSAPPSPHTSQSHNDMLIARIKGAPPNATTQDISGDPSVPADKEQG